MKTLKYTFAILFISTFLFSCEAEDVNIEKTGTELDANDPMGTELDANDPMGTELDANDPM